jgi:hypothetical protein
MNRDRSADQRGLLTRATYVASASNNQLAKYADLQWILEAL